MAQNANEQFQSANGKGSGLRFFPSVVQPKSFASGSGTLAVGTALAFNTSTSLWVVFTSGGANGTGSLRGFVWPDPVVLNASDEVTGNVMLAGRVHLDDIPIVSGYTLAQLKTELQANAKNQGIIVEGMVSFR